MTLCSLKRVIDGHASGLGGLSFSLTVRMEFAFPLSPTANTKKGWIMQSQNNQGKRENATQANRGAKTSVKNPGDASSLRDERQDSGAAKVEGSPDASQKSVGAVIADSLAKDTQQKVDTALSSVGSAVESVKEYVAENPKEAIALALSIVGAGWALLYTKPGRHIFDQAAPVVVPKISSWLTSSFSPEVKH